MAREARVQEKLIKYLRAKGCYVIKPQGPGTPVGCPDVIALYEGFWAAFEVKATRTSPYKPLQKETLSKLGAWSFARVVHSDNLDEVIAELENIL